MPIFNNVIDVGIEDEMVLSALNILVVVHLIAFIVLVIIVVRNMMKSEQQIFAEQVEKLKKHKKE